MIRLIAIGSALSLSLAAAAHAQNDEGDHGQPSTQISPAANTQAAPPEIVPGQQPRNSVAIDAGPVKELSIPGQAMHTGRPVTTKSPTRPCSPGSQSQTPPGTSPGGIIRHEESSTSPAGVDDELAIGRRR
jgi:hypothetical protein